MPQTTSTHAIARRDSPALGLATGLGTALSDSIGGGVAAGLLGLGAAAAAGYGVIKAWEASKTADQRTAEGAAQTRREHAEARWRGPDPHVGSSRQGACASLTKHGTHSAYSRPQQVLFLSEGGRGWRHVADKVAANHPATHVTRTDYSYRWWNEGTSGNLTTKFVDNTKPLPFDDDTFGTIVMNRGLCLCDSKTNTCGGIENTVTKAQVFFDEVARVLDKSDPEALAYLEGEFGNTKQSTAIWRTAAARTLKVYPELTADIVTQGCRGTFKALRLTRRTDA